MRRSRSVGTEGFEHYVDGDAGSKGLLDHAASFGSSVEPLKAPWIRAGFGTQFDSAVHVLKPDRNLHVERHRAAEVYLSSDFDDEPLELDTEDVRHHPNRRILARGKRSAEHVARRWLIMKPTETAVDTDRNGDTTTGHWLDGRMKRVVNVGPNCNGVVGHQGRCRFGSVPGAQGFLNFADPRVAQCFTPSLS